MSTPGYDIGALINSIVTAFVNTINAIASAIADNATTIGQAIAVGLIIAGITYAFVRTPILRWLRRVIPF